MQKTLYTTILLSCLFLMNSQLQPLAAQKVTISEQIELARDIACDIIYSYDNQLLLYRRSRSRHYVEAFNVEDLKQSWKKEIEYPKNNIGILQLIAEDDFFTIVYAMHLRGKTEIRAKQVNTKGEQTDDYSLGNFFVNIPFGDLNLRLSENKQKLLVYVIQPDNNVDWFLFNLKDKEQHWYRERSFADINYSREFERILVNNEGEVFLITELNKQKRQREEHAFQVHRMGLDGVVKDLKVPFPNVTAIDTYFAYDELNQQVMAGGLYSESNQKSHGLFYLRCAVEDTFILATNEFEESFIRSLTGEKKKKLDGIANLEMSDLILRRDGGMICIAEQNFKYEYQLMSTFYNEDTPGRQADFLYENVLIASIHPTGELHWKEVMYKSQSSENDDGRYSSYFLMKTQSNLRLLYNDDIRWMTNIFEYVVDVRGEIERNRIFLKGKTAIMPEFRDAVQVSADRVFALSPRGNRFKIVKIVY